MMSVPLPGCRRALIHVLLGLAALLGGFVGAAHAVTYTKSSTGYAWIDPSAHTNVTWSSTSECSGGGMRSDDDITAPINIGFTFNFGGTGYTQLRVMSNGRIQFGNNFCGYGTQTVSPVTYPYGYPNSNLNRTMKLYGADLDPSATGSGTTCAPATCHVRYASLGASPNRSFVVTWTNVPEWSQAGSSFTMQAILYENGEFVFQFGASTNTSGGRAETGWQVSTTDYQVAATTLPASGTALRFWQPPAQTICIPPGYVLDAGPSSLTLGTGNTVNGTAVSGSGDALLAFGARTTRSTTTAAINPSGFPSFSASTSTSSTNLPGGTYATVTAGAAGFTFTGGTYYIKNLTVTSTTVTFGPGDYYIENGTYPANLTVTVSPSGPVRLFLPGLAPARNGMSLNAGGDPANLQIYLYGASGLLFGDSFNVNAILYSSGGGTLYFGNNGSFTGAAITTGAIQFGNTNQFTYSASTLASVTGVAPCAAATVAAFVVTSASSASTCVPQSVTVRAVDSLGNIVTTYTGTARLTTSAGRGGWAAGSSSGSVTETGTTNDGAASYAFRSTDYGQAVLSLSDQSADDLTVTATDSTAASVTGTSGTISFRDNAFVITASDSLSTTAVAGRPHAMTASLYRRDTSQSPANCAIATNYTGAKNLKGWYTADLSHPSGATAPGINGGSALGTSVPGSNNVALTFSAGVATFNLTTTDVGKYVINLRDDSRTFASAVNIDGSSPTMTVRPFAIAITGVSKGATVNPEGTATGGSKFVAAGDTFAATVGGYLWQSADDANNDGTPDAGANVINNGLAPHFAWSTALTPSSAAGDFTPGSGTLGTLGGTTTLASGSFSGGSATVSNLTYSEVGSVGLDAGITGYLNTSGVDLTGTAVNASTGQGARVGRFYPDHFTLVSGAAVTAACSAGNFTYMDQPALAVSYTIQARSVADALTTNYRATVYTVGSVSAVAENADTGTSLAARVSGWPSVSWTLGQYVMSASGVTFARAASPDGPFDSLVLGVTVSDPDGALLASRDMNAAATSCGGGCDAKALNAAAATRVRFGRLRVGNALGSPPVALPVPLTVEYWNGVGFATNALDSCTRLTNTQIAFGNFRSPLAACLTSGTPTGSNGVVFSSGRGNFKLSRPAVRGSVDLTVQLGATATGNSCSGGASVTATAASQTWLRGNWGATTYDRNPAGRAVFGVHSNSSDVIFLRESY
ncbi:MAG: DUF6701 domain-containing protein [Burkholderiales bacterium]